MDAPTIHGISFSEDDRLFVGDQAIKAGMLKEFIILMAVGEVILDQIEGMEKGSEYVKKVRDFLLELDGTDVSVTSKTWEDVVEPLKSVMTGTVKMDLQLHITGNYQAIWIVDRRKKLRAPKGKARNFFVALLHFYSSLPS